MSVITPKDDEFHFGQMSDRWWETETCWFSFCAPKRRLGGWLYTMVRPNIGNVAGGVWIWDDTAHLPWEVPYSTNYSVLRLPENPDLRDITFPTGVSLKMREPLKNYDLEVNDGERLKLRLNFDAIMPPQPLKKADSVFSGIGHFDQYGRVTGEIRLHGELIPIDCLAIRDRSWGPRAEHRPPKSAYVTGIASPQNAFLAVTKGGNEHKVAYGFLMRNGTISDLVKGERIIQRCPKNGWVTHIVIRGKDQQGRVLNAEGRRISGMIIDRRSFIDSNGLIEWSIDGDVGHGEDQDMWPVHQWSAFRAGRPY